MNYNCTVTATIMNVLYNVARIPTVIFSNCGKKVILQTTPASSHSTITTGRKQHLSGLRYH